jgi:hypothetical protein
MVGTFVIAHPQEFKHQQTIDNMDYTWLQMGPLQKGWAKQSTSQ